MRGGGQWLILVIRRFFGNFGGFGGGGEEEEEQIPKGADVVVELECSLKDLYLGHSFKVLHTLSPCTHLQPLRWKPLRHIFWRPVWSISRCWKMGGGGGGGQEKPFKPFKCVWN
jgi:DnaJ-class molecular chaperone